MNLLDSTYDPHTGMTEEFWHNPVAGTITIRRLQDVQGQLSDNRRLFNQHSGKTYGDSKGGAHLVARIPFVVVEKWLREGFDWYASTDKERRNMLNKPEHRYLLVRPGTL